MQGLTSLSRDDRNQNQFNIMLGLIEGDLQGIRGVPVDGSVLKHTGIAKYISKLQGNSLLSPQLAKLCADIIDTWKQQVKTDHRSSTINALKGGCIVAMPVEVRRPGFIPERMWSAFRDAYNASQLCAIEYVCRPLNPNQDNRISLIQGPPGTGKTATIIGDILICRLMNSCNHAL
jgi:hypothetical protein